MARYNFESHNIKGFYIRHSNFQRELTRRGGPEADFYFDLKSRGKGKVAFRSANFPDRFLRHRDFHLWIEPPAGPDDELFEKDATFDQTPAPVIID